LEEPFASTAARIVIPGPVRSRHFCITPENHVNRHSA
jgi:hypothetical protein